MARQGLRTLCCSVAGLLALAAGARADIVNGDFENGLTGWSIESGSFTTLEDATGNWVAYSTGGRLRQFFQMPPAALTLSFRYAFYQFDNADPDTPPHDFLSVYLQDPLTFANFIPPPPGCEGFPSFYTEDHLGLYGINVDYVSVTPPGPDGLRTVSVDVSSLPPGQEVRLEFGLFNFANNGRDSYLVLDDVAVAVPEPTSAAPWTMSGLAFCRRHRSRRLA